MAVQILINSEDKTKYVAWESLRIKNVLTTKVDSCSFTIRNYGNRIYVPVVGREVIIYDNATKVFAGHIVRRTQKFSWFKVVEYECECVDYSRLLSKRLVSNIYENMTINAIIQHLIDHFSIGGFTTNNVSCTTEIEYIAFNYQPLDKCLEELAKLVNYDYYVDYDKDIHFRASDSVSAPYDITETNGKCDLNTLVIRQDNSQVRNTIIVRGGDYESSRFTADIECNGTDYVYPLPYKFSEFRATLTGQVMNVGIDFSGDPNYYDALHNKSEKVIKFREARTPSNGSLLRVSGLPILPLIIKLEAPEKVSAMLSAEGVAGDYEFLVVDSTLENKQAARDRANAEITAYGDTLCEGEFETEEAGLRAGQTININVPSLGIDSNYIINKVDSRMFSETGMKYTISLISTKSKDMIGLLQQILLNQTKQIKVRENEIIDLINSYYETLNISESVSSLISHNPQTETIALTEAYCNRELNFDVRFVLGPYSPPTNTQVTEDSYSETNYNGGQYINGASGYNASGQSFTASANGVSLKCKFYLAKGGATGLPTGNAYAKLYSHSGTYGTSSVPNVLLATSDALDVSTLTGSYQLITFNFTGDNQCSLILGTYYCITFEFSGGDANNVVRVGYDSSSPTHSGNLVRRTVAGVWGALSTYDTVFYVYAETTGYRQFILDGSPLA